MVKAEWWRGGGGSGVEVMMRGVAHFTSKLPGVTRFARRPSPSASSERGEKNVPPYIAKKKIKKK